MSSTSNQGQDPVVQGCQHAIEPRIMCQQPEPLRQDTSQSNTNNADLPPIEGRDDPSSSRQKSKKRVRWSTIQVHVHQVELGDNPATSAGPPITIGWHAMQSQVLALDDYEMAKPPNRTKSEMRLPRSVREDWLREQGYARSELNEAAEQVAKAKQLRARSAKDGELFLLPMVGVKGIVIRALDTAKYHQQAAREFGAKTLNNVMMAKSA